MLELCVRIESSHSNLQQIETADTPLSVQMWHDTVRPLL